MPRHKGHIVAQRPQLGHHGSNQGVWIAAREVCTADGSLEQHVSDLGEAGRPVEEDHMARSVPRTMGHLPGRLAQGDGVAVDKPARRVEGASVGKAPAAALFAHAGDPEVVFQMRPHDRRTRLLRHFRGAGRMVEVAMGDPDLIQHQAAP